MKVIKDHNSGVTFHHGGTGGAAIVDAFAHGDHRVPQGAQVVESKYCQACGNNFLRAAGSQDKYCRRCHALPTMSALTQAIH